MIDGAALAVGFMFGYLTAMLTLPIFGWLADD